MTIAAIGLVAGGLTTTAWLPQLHRTWRSRSAHDLSWAYLVTTTTGIALWLLYGFLSGDIALIVGNVVTIVLLVGLVALKASHSRRPHDTSLDPTSTGPPSTGLSSPLVGAASGSVGTAG